MYSNRPRDYIGKIVKIRLPYYDTKNSKVSFKVRPGLIIGCEKDQYPCDFSYLPVSKIKDKTKRHFIYDLELNRKNCKVLSLNHFPSFIRCHKVSTVYCTDVDKNHISDLKDLKPSLFHEIKSTFDTFATNLF